MKRICAALCLLVVLCSCKNTAVKPISTCLSVVTHKTTQVTETTVEEDDNADEEEEESTAFHLRNVLLEKLP